MADHRHWLGLMIGNSRLHWVYFQDDVLMETWQTPHVDPNLSDRTAFFPMGIPSISANCPLYLASVVPSQTLCWQDNPHTHLITLKQIPLDRLYPTLGCDRALAALGAGEKYGFPVLVIDGGTALTLTGIDAARSLVGGAILPGLRLQFQALAQKTAQLPEMVLPSILPPRWSISTQEAIASGILYSVLASLESYITDWQSQFPQSAILLTGGDGSSLGIYWQQKHPDWAKSITLDPDLIFWGMRALRHPNPITNI